jgi:4-hydroxy-tetrahydrodipicolinate reductase
MTTNIIINGACGKMGREIAAAVLSDGACALAGCVEQASHPAVGKDYGALTGLDAPGMTVSGSIVALAVDKSVIIDFTSPEASLSLLDAVEGKQVRLVIGTTGFDNAGTRRIAKAAKKTPVVLSPNMSLGVNLLFALTDLAAKKLGAAFDIEIIEAHHRYKKDSPSGTARALGEIAASAMGMTYEEAVKNGRSGMTGGRTNREIGMHAVRGGDIVGDHTVLFAGLGERLELRHVMHSRATLARGAVIAAKWLAGQKPGLYTMRDVLGL